MRPELCRLRVPTLIVWGTGDAFFPIKWGRQLAELIPGTTLHTTDGAPGCTFPTNGPTSSSHFYETIGLAPGADRGYITHDYRTLCQHEP
jgi:pimeloyl-ACP methyl ester carboxylesterase